MSYATDRGATLLSNAYGYLNKGDMLPSVPSAENLIATATRGFIPLRNDLARVGNPAFRSIT